MEIKIIKSEQEYEKAISLLEEIGDNPNFENDEKLLSDFESLEKLIGDYEKINYPINKGNPIEIIKLKMTYMGLVQKDLIDVIGSKGVVSEVMNKKRGLSKNMIRNLSKFLNINQEILNTKYELNEQKNTKKDKKDFTFLIPLGMDVLGISKTIRSRGTTIAMCA